MSTTAKWMIGLVVGLLVLIALPFIWGAIFPSVGYGMMGYRHMPMMGASGFGFLPFGMFFLWLIPVGLLALLVLGIASLVKYLTTKAG
jgi:hypothetical protein